jgi:hypothetical protein
MMKLVSTALIFLFGLFNTAVAQESVVQKEVRGKSGKISRIAVFANVQPDCTSGPLPTIRLLNEPEHGKIIVKRAKVSATNVKNCLSLTVPALVMFYQAAAHFQGSDFAVVQLLSADGKTQEQRYTIRVSADAKERDI